MTLPADAVPVIDWPEYAITPGGEVWRVEANHRADTRADLGPVPRIVKHKMMGGGGAKKSPSVTLSSYRGRSSRTIRSLVRQHFGE